VCGAWQYAWDPPGGDGAATLLFGAWRLAVCDSLKAVWT